VPSAVRAAPDNAGIVAPAPVLYAAAFITGVFLHWRFPQPVLPLSMAPSAALALLAGGAVLAVWSRRTLESANTNVHPSLPATALVVSGPFRFSRNPMYLARTLLYVGLACLANALAVLALLVPLLAVVHYGIIRREEHYLETKFGDAYRRYRATVRRWL